jgi:hypothetical protein
MPAKISSTTAGTLRAGSAATAKGAGNATSATTKRLPNPVPGMVSS